MSVDCGDDYGDSMSKALKIPTDRSFGFTFAVVSGLIGAWLWWRANRYAPAAFAVGAAFAAAAVLMPRVLHPLNVVWMRFGALLNKVVSPVILGAVFLVAFVPFGLLFRLTGRDALNRSFEPGRRSYWIDRTPPGPPPQSFPRQF